MSTDVATPEARALRDVLTSRRHELGELLDTYGATNPLPVCSAWPSLT